jgi:hypothetical protein
VGVAPVLLALEPPPERGDNLAFGIDHTRLASYGIHDLRAEGAAPEGDVRRECLLVNRRQLIAHHAG